jgi:hypothetical protein
MPRLTTISVLNICNMWNYRRYKNRFMRLVDHIPAQISRTNRIPKDDQFRSVSAMPWSSHSTGSTSELMELSVAAGELAHPDAAH